MKNYAEKGAENGTSLFVTEIGVFVTSDQRARSRATMIMTAIMIAITMYL